MVRFFYLLSLSIWIGAVTFFSFGVAPSIFRALPRPQAGDAVAAIFPLYYVFGGVAGALVCLLGWLMWPRALDRRWRMAHTAIAAAMLLATLVAGVVIQPRASALRLELRGDAPPPAAQADFDRLHRWSVQLNAAVLLGGLLLLAGTSRRFDRPRL